jgi:hypothetical protein
MYLGTMIAEKHKHQLCLGEKNTRKIMLSTSKIRMP